MSGPPHQYNTGFQNSPGMRNQFGGPQMSGQMGGGMQNPMAGQLGNQVPMQMGGQMVPQMSNTMSQMGQTSMGGGMGQMTSQPLMGGMNQQFSVNTGLQENLMQATQSQLQQQMQQQQLQQMQQQQQQQLQQMQVQQGTGQMPVQGQLPTQVNQQQNVTSNVPSNTTSATPPAPQPVPSKEINTVSLCRIGQETVQDIVSRTQEVFQNLKAIQPPNGTVQGSNSSNEKKARVQEQLRTIRVLFKRLRLIFEKCNENCQLQGMEYTHIESLIPLKDEPDTKSDEKKSSEAYRLICEEHKEIMEQVVLKNKQLKEVIDHLRRIIWEINTMLAMRRS